MAFELKEGQGSLFKNDKGDNASRPDYTGNILIGGVEKRIAGWVKKGQKGSFLSLQISDKRDKQNQGQPQHEPGAPDINDLPF